MRFIRDIIKDKRSTAAAHADVELAPPAKQAGHDPLVLDPALFPAAADHAAPEPDALEMPVESRAAPQAAPTSPRSPADTADDEVQALLRVIAQSDEGSNAHQEAASLPSGTDPFDKLRGADAEPRTQSPSPMSSSASPRRVKPSAPAPQTAADIEDLGLDDLMPLADAMEDAPLQMPSPALGRGSNRSGRVKTRLLGFSASAMETDDPFDKNPSLDSEFPVGWLVITSDQGRGASFALQDGVSTVGRGTDQTVCLNFGDNSISRSAHVSIAFDAEKNKFYIGHGGKSNLVRLNDAPLLSTEELRSKDIIRMGETTLRFIALCEGDFGWTQPKGTQAAHA